MSYVSRTGLNRMQNSPVEIIGLIDQLLQTFEESTASLKQDSGLFLARLIDITNCIHPFGESESSKNVMRCIQQLKTLALDQQNYEQVRCERISKRISLVQESLEAIRTEASLDVLTQVADLNNFNCTLPRWIMVHEKSGTPFTLAFFCLASCRQTNDSRGHPIGDRIPALIALELGRNIRERDFLARCSGNEFAVISAGMKLATAAKRFSALLQQFGTTRCRNNDTESPAASFAVSCGIAEYSPGERAEDLINRAQNALYDAKELGDNHVAVRTELLLRDCSGQGLPFPGNTDIREFRHIARPGSLL
jgi:diguanylate cyclase